MAPVEPNRMGLSHSIRAVGVAGPITSHSPVCCATKTLTVQVNWKVTTMDNIWLWIASFAVAAISAYLCVRIATRKGRSPLGYGILGFFLPLIGLIVVAVLPSRAGQISA